MSTTTPLQKHHKLCDEDFALAEEAAHKGNWEACAKAYTKFKTELLEHFALEDEVLFTKFIELTGMTGDGPPSQMAAEHVQMRDLIKQMDDALEKKNADTFGGVAETLLLMMQQHNMKEENILYPMLDQQFDGDREIQEKVRALVEQ